MATRPRDVVAAILPNERCDAVSNEHLLKFKDAGIPGLNLDSTFTPVDTNPFRDGINTLRIGGQGRGGVSRFFNGKIDEPRIYSRALTQAEIQYDMNTALPTTVADTTPPVISAVAVPVTTASGATITWTTDEPADSQVQYGLTNTYGSSTTLAPSLVTAHSVAVTGLAEATLYHYRVKSKDAAGNLAVSADGTFSTADVTAPSLSITAPMAGATVARAVTVTASAAVLPSVSMPVKLTGWRFPKVQAPVTPVAGLKVSCN